MRVKLLNHTKNRILVMCTLSNINVLRSLCSVLLFLVLAGNFQLPLCYILCADNLIPCSLENKFEVSSCSGSLCVYNIPRSYHLAELPQVLIVCYERIRQLLGSTECVLGSLLIELPGGGPSLASLPDCLTSPRAKAIALWEVRQAGEKELLTWPCRCSVPNEAQWLIPLKFVTHPRHHGHVVCS